VDIRLEDQGNGRYQIVDADAEKQVGVVISQDDGSYGYSLFGTPHMGAEESIDKVQKAVERHLG
jgi:hypothetical protein